MSDNSPLASRQKNPWFDEMSVEEFKAYYERKLERIEELSTECERDGCENTARYPRDFCSTQCLNNGFQQAAKRLEELVNDAE